MNPTSHFFRRIPLALAALLAAALIAFAVGQVPFAFGGKTVRAGVNGDNIYSPKTVTISRGGKVTWRFSGKHNVYGNGKGWLINLKSSGTWSRKFPKKGRFNYLCTIHPGMTGTVVVR